MTDSGKHSALRQTDDGSFEIVLDREGLQEVSEEEISAAEVVAPQAPEATATTSNRILVFSVIGVAALLTITAVGWYALSPDTEVASNVDEASGFKPYVGGAESDSSAKRRSAGRERAAAAVEQIDEQDEAEAVAEAEPVEEEITEDEAGWELSEAAEDGVIVEVEGTDPEEEVIEADEVATEDVVTEDVDEIDTNRPARSVLGRRGLNALRGQDIGRNITPPRVPSLNTTPLATERLKTLPIRNLDDDYVEHPRSDEESDGEVGDDDEIVEEELR